MLSTIREGRYNEYLFTDKEPEGSCDLLKVTQLDTSRFRIPTQVFHGILLQGLAKHKASGVSLGGVFGWNYNSSAW